MITKKRIISLFLSLMMIFSVFPITDISIFAETDVLDYLTWEIIGDEVTITDCDTSISGDVVIPDTIEGYPVTAIGDGAFDYCINLNNITLPSTLKSIGKFAFCACSYVEELVLPDSIETIGDSAFAYMCSIKKINIPENIQHIGDSAFVYLLNLKEITIPAGVENFSYDIANFPHSFALESIVNNSSTAVLEILALPSFDRIEYAEAYAYMLFTLLKYNFGIENTLPGFTITEKELIEDAINYFNNKLHTNLIASDYNSIDDLITTFDYIGNHQLGLSYPPYFSVTCLAESVQHEYCRENSIMHKTIGESDFCDCYITDGTLGDNITWSINTQTKTLTFDGTGMLVIDDIPEYSIYSGFINNICFSENSSITSILGPAFYGLMNVTEITIPEGVIELGDNCFSGSGISVINLPKSLSSVDSLAFVTGNCVIEEINVASGNSNFISFEGSLYMNYVEYNNEMTYILVKQPEKNANSFLNNTIGIYYGAFENYSAATEITVPDSVLYICEAAFSTCISLKTINIGNSKIYEADGETATIEIDERCCYVCNNLTSINVDSNNINYSSVDGVLYNKDITELIIGPAGKTEIVLPETVSYVSRHNGLDSPRLKKVTILNTSCEIFDDSSSIDSDATIYGYTNSTAQAYAEKYNRTFIAIDGETCSHDYAETITPPTCTEQGYTTYTCSACGDTYIDDYVDATDHDWDNGVIDPESTCNTHGTKTYTCQNDNSHTYTEEVALNENNHVGETYIKDAIEPDCTNDGYTGDTYCADCNTKITDGETIPPTDHDYSNEWTVDVKATCETVGSKSHHCSRCDEKTDITEIEKEEHLLQHSSVPSTCKVAGVEYDMCLTCFDMFNYNVLPLADHTWSDWSTVTEPDCITTGLEKRICSVCDIEEKNVLPATDHDYVTTVTPPTCEAQGYTTYTCSACGDTYTADYVDASGHSFGEWTETVAPTFINFGEEERICASCRKTETNILDKLVPTEEIVNEETGVSVSVTDDTYEGDITVDVVQVYDGESYQIINAQIGNFAATVFDITTYVNGEKTQPSGVVLVKIPIPAGYNPETLIVYHLPNDGSAPQKMNSYTDGNYICFETNHFSEYVIIDESQNNSDTTDCSCNCHSTNAFVKFFYKIARFFWKLFGMEEKRICACSAAHW